MTLDFYNFQRVVRAMLSTHPYTFWPLHVKLFTPEAVKGWVAACKNPTPLPPGFTCCVELEGVDGKRDDVGSGRTGPMDVTDSMSLIIWLQLSSHISHIIIRNFHIGAPR